MTSGQLLDVSRQSAADTIDEDDFVCIRVLTVRVLDVVGKNPVTVNAENDVDNDKHRNGQTLDPWRNSAPSNVLRTSVSECRRDGDIPL